MSPSVMLLARSNRFCHLADAISASPSGSRPRKRLARQFPAARPDGVSGSLNDKLSACHLLADTATRTEFNLPAPEMMRTNFRVASVATLVALGAAQDASVGNAGCPCLAEPPIDAFVIAAGEAGEGLLAARPNGVDVIPYPTT
eukprot:COSAG06_NODE_3006_length_5969_cov_2.756218_8_plen_143_part_01